MSGSLSDYRPTMIEATEAYLLVERWLGQHLDIMPVGSFGRNYRDNNVGFGRVGDVDLVVTGNAADLEDARDRMGHIFGYFKNGKPRNIGVIGRIQIDLFFTPIEVAGATELFYLLPHPLQFAVRKIAEVRGLSFGPKGVKDGDKVLETRYPSDVYKLLGIEPFGYAAIANPKIAEIPHRADREIANACAE